MDVFTKCFVLVSLKFKDESGIFRLLFVERSPLAHLTRCSSRLVTLAFVLKSLCSFHKSSELRDIFTAIGYSFLSTLVFVMFVCLSVFVIEVISPPVFTPDKKAIKVIFKSEEETTLESS